MSFRRFFLILTIILFIVAGLIWILNIEGIINGTWSTPLSAFFTILAALSAFIQVILLISPPSSTKPDPSANSAVSSLISKPVPKIPLAAPLMEKDSRFPPSFEDYQQFAESIKRIILTEQGKGSIVIYTEHDMIDKSIYLISVGDWTIYRDQIADYLNNKRIRHEYRHRKYYSSIEGLWLLKKKRIRLEFFNHKLIYTASFDDLNDGAYILFSIEKGQASVIVSQDSITMVDWR